jgi:hypothetical protein
MLYTEMVMLRGGLKPVGIKGARSLKERSPYTQSIEPTESEYYTRSEVTHNDMRYDTGGRQGPYTACQEHPTKRPSPKKGSQTKTDSVVGIPNVGWSRAAPDGPNDGRQHPGRATDGRRPAGGKLSLQMTYEPAP